MAGVVIAYPPGDHWSGDTAGRRDLHRAGTAVREALSPIERLELLLHPCVAFIVLPLFALANAGVPMLPGAFDSTLVLAIFLGFIVGKPIGVLAFTALAVKLRVAVRPGELRWSKLAGGGLLTGIGFTMVLFIAELAYDPDLLDSAKLGILVASIASAIAGVVALAVSGHAKAATSNV